MDCRKLHGSIIVSIPCQHLSRFFSHQLWKSSSIPAQSAELVDTLKKSVLFLDFVVPPLISKKPELTDGAYKLQCGVLFEIFMLIKAEISKITFSNIEFIPKSIAVQ